jgi:uncharacterized membrane protein
MAGTSTLEKDSSAGLEGRCEKCYAPLGGGRTSVCKQCGWYAIAGTFVDIDRAWEGEPQPVRPEDARLPRWAWVLIGSALLIVVTSIAVRLATPAGSFRMYWSGAQFLLGLAGFFFCQIMGFIILMREDASAVFIEILIKPFKVSAALFRRLPRGLWIVNLGISGLLATLAAVAIIGSVPYHVLWSWNVDYRSTQALEDAIGVAENGGGDLSELGVGIAEKPPLRKKIVCVIIGFELSDTGNLRSVLVARVDHGKLRYVGGLEPSGDPAMLFELRENLMAVERHEPIIPMTFDSNWVLPVYSCEVSYSSEQENRNLTDMEWEGNVRRLD